MFKNRYISFKVEIKDNGNVFFFIYVIMYFLIKPTSGYVFLTIFLTKRILIKHKINVDS